MLYESDKNNYFDTAAKESRNHKYKPHPEPTPRGIPSMTLFVRMAGKLKEHRGLLFTVIFSELLFSSDRHRLERQS